MSVREEAGRTVSMWLLGQHASAIRALRALDRGIALAVCCQAVLMLLDHDREEGAEAELPRFVEMLEETAFDDRLLKVSSVMDL